jgi:hypothetical protein
MRRGQMRREHYNAIADSVEHVLNMFLRVYYDFPRLCFQSHLLITKRISSSLLLPANRKRDFCSNTTNRIPMTFLRNAIY